MTAQERAAAVTVSHIERRLRGTAEEAPPGGDAWLRERNWPASWKNRANSLRAAGVLVPIIDRPTAGPSVLLTRRAHELRHHAGQVSFPGGAMESGDATIVVTALRETEEEVGVGRDQIRVCGALRSMPTLTGYVVTPIVGILPRGVRLTLEPGEVERAFEVPLAFLLDAANEHCSERVVEGVSMPLREFHYGGERIWGATAAIVAELRNTIV